MADKIDAKRVLPFLPVRDDNSNKGSFGKVLNIAGSERFSGAAYLSSKSALRVGAGYVILACPDKIIQRIAPSLSEITYLPLNTNTQGTIDKNNFIDNLFEYDVISLGCGLTTNRDTQDFVIDLLKKVTERQKLIV